MTLRVYRRRCSSATWRADVTRKELATNGISIIAYPDEVTRLAGALYPARERQIEKIFAGIFFVYTRIRTGFGWRARCSSVAGAIFASSLPVPSLGCRRDSSMPHRCGAVRSTEQINTRIEGRRVAALLPDGKAQRGSEHGRELVRTRLIAARCRRSLPWAIAASAQRWSSSPQRSRPAHRRIVP